MILENKKFWPLFFSSWIYDWYMLIELGVIQNVNSFTWEERLTEKMWHFQVENPKGSLRKTCFVTTFNIETGEYDGSNCVFNMQQSMPILSWKWGLKKITILKLFSHKGPFSTWKSQRFHLFC